MDGQATTSSLIGGHRRVFASGVTAARVMVAWARRSIAWAAPPPPPRCESKLDGASPRLVDTDPWVRLSWIDTRLSASARTARRWAWGWGGGIAASGVASLAVVPFVAGG